MRVGRGRPVVPIAGHQFDEVAPRGLARVGGADSEEEPLEGGEVKQAECLEVQQVARHLL